MCRCCSWLCPSDCSTFLATLRFVGATMINIGAQNLSERVILKVYWRYIEGILKVYLPAKCQIRICIGWPHVSPRNHNCTWNKSPTWLHQTGIMTVRLYTGRCIGGCSTAEPHVFLAHDLGALIRDQLPRFHMIPPQFVQEWFWDRNM